MLEPYMRHKIGMGKPVGLGSVKITVESIKRINSEFRYKTLGGGITELAGTELQKYIEKMTQSYIDNNSATMQALRRIWQWPGQYEIQYPSQQWFEEHPHDTIEKT